MSAGRTDHDFLADILDAARKARGFVEGMRYEDFADDSRTTFAVTRALEIVGEAAKSVSAEVRDAHPEIPWRDMAAMRDKLSHGYFGVSSEVLWKTVHEDLPALEISLSKCLTPAAEA
ncbi:MAG TPA: DUF86 domain-containing protein [Thermoanaerobaculia bacterium]|nr:DUF86 domain-containing protein [Thermoanaerobaculia bacterium]